MTMCSSKFFNKTTIPAKTASTAVVFADPYPGKFNYGLNTQMYPVQSFRQIKPKLERTAASASILWGGASVSDMPIMTLMPIQSQFCAGRSVILSMWMQATGTRHNAVSGGRFASIHPMWGRGRRSLVCRMVVRFWDSLQFNWTGVDDFVVLLGSGDSGLSVRRHSNQLLYEWIGK